MPLPRSTVSIQEGEPIHHHKHRDYHHKQRQHQRVSTPWAYHKQAHSHHKGRHLLLTSLLYTSTPLHHQRLHHQHFKHHKRTQYTPHRLQQRHQSPLLQRSNQQLKHQDPLPHHPQPLKATTHQPSQPNQYTRQQQTSRALSNKSFNPWPLYRSTQQASRSPQRIKPPRTL